MKRMVIKIGSSSLISNGILDEKRLDTLINEISILRNNDCRCVIVTSGSIAVGAYNLGCKPKDISMKQACAAVGQAILMNGYKKVCDNYNLKCAQILVNHDDFENRKRMLHLENTLNTLINNDVIPIINENDALAVEEIMVGDNDTLSALIAPMANADLLVLLSDIDGLYTDNPKINKDATLIKKVERITPEIKKMAHPSSTAVGTGGMETKIKAAIISNASGIDMIIQNANRIDSLRNAFGDNYEGTKFIADKKINARSQWILFKTRPTGTIMIDKGCMEAILERKSLLASGIVNVDGLFDAGDVINLSFDGKVIAKGISEFNSFELLKIKGTTSKEYSKLLGYDAKTYVAHANNIVVIEGSDYE